jgi:hypothetical protein
MVTRMMLNIVIIYAVFTNGELMENVCGPFTLPIASKWHLFNLICLMELLRICGPSIVGKLWKKHHSQYLVAKYIIILGFKILLIFDEAHRKKFYLHTFLL